MAPLRLVTNRQLQDLFNKGGYWEKAERNELKQTVERSHHPAPPPHFLPPCTHSQIVAYRERLGKVVALVHQYLRPDGTLGASGLPDPKFLFHKGVRYQLKKVKKT
jgi:hypothetical protein